LRQVVPRLNLEMACTPEMTNIASAVLPNEATLVPEKRQELTTEGGLDVLAHQQSVAAAVQRLSGKGILVSLFIDPDLKHVEISRKLGAQAVEFQTASYSEARTEAQRLNELSKLAAATAAACGLGLHVHMGHGLNYWNVQPIVRIPGVEE